MFQFQKFFYFTLLLSSLIIQSYGAPTGITEMEESPQLTMEVIPESENTDLAPLQFNPSENNATQDEMNKNEALSPAMVPVPVLGDNSLTGLDKVPASDDEIQRLFEAKTETADNNKEENLDDLVPDSKPELLPVVAPLEDVNPKNDSESESVILDNQASMDVKLCTAQSTTECNESQVAPNSHMLPIERLEESIPPTTMADHSDKPTEVTKMTNTDSTSTMTDTTIEVTTEVKNDLEKPKYEVPTRLDILLPGFMSQFSRIYSAIKEEIQNPQETSSGEEQIPEFKYPNLPIVPEEPLPIPEPPTVEKSEFQGKVSTSNIFDTYLTSPITTSPSIPVHYHAPEPEVAAGYHGKCRHNRIAPLYQPYFTLMVQIPIPIYQPKIDRAFSYNVPPISIGFPILKTKNKIVV